MPSPSPEHEQGSPGSATSGVRAVLLGGCVSSPGPRVPEPLLTVPVGLNTSLNPSLGRLLVLPILPAPGFGTFAWESLWPRGVSEEFGPGARAGHIGSLVCPGAGDSSQAQFLVQVPACGLRQCFPGFPPFPVFPGVVLGEVGVDPTPPPSKICHLPLLPFPWETQLPPQLCLVPSMALAASSSHGLGAFFLCCWFEKGGTGQTRHPFDFYPRFLALSL